MASEALLVLNDLQMLVNSSEEVSRRRIDSSALQFYLETSLGEVETEIFFERVGSMFNGSEMHDTSVQNKGGRESYMATFPSIMNSVLMNSVIIDQLPSLYVTHCIFELFIIMLSFSNSNEVGQLVFC